MNRKNICLVLPMVLLASCATSQMNENQRFVRAISKDVPFRMENLQVVDGDAFRFENFDINVAPDYVMDSDKVVGVHTTFNNPAPELSDTSIWRNLYFNTRQHRIICVDRFLQNGKRVGYVYLMQMESKKWPRKGGYHWDVTDRRNMQLVMPSLEYFRKQSQKVMSSKSR